MTLSTEAASEELEAGREELADVQAHVDEHGETPNALNRLAEAKETIARCLAILGPDKEALSAFEDAGEAYLDLVHLSWEAGPNSSYRRNIPEKLNTAIGCALVARADELVEEVAVETKRLSNEDFHEFVLSGEGTAFDRFKYYTAQVLGALALGEDVEGDSWGSVQASRPSESVLEAHRTEAKAANEDALVPMSDILVALTRDDGDRVSERIEHRLEQRAEEFGDDPRTVHEAVAVTEAKYVHLAARRGLDVRVESEYLPEVLLPVIARS